MVRNMALLEAMESKEVNTFDKAAVIASIKKLMNTAKLSKFKSQSYCGQFYSTFFLSTLNEVNPTVQQWGDVYTELLSSDPFCEDLARFMVAYRPSSFAGLFAPLWNKVQLELAEMKQNQVRYLSLTKALFTMLQTRLDGVGQIVRSQVNDPEVMKFVTVTNMTLGQMINDMNKMIQAEITKAADPDSLVIDSRIHGNKLSEDAIELIALFEHADEFFRPVVALQEAAMAIKNGQDDEMDEGIVRNAAMKAKELAVAAKKAERDFDQFVMRKVRKMRENRRNRKHSEMVGEALAINHEIKRVLKSGAWYIVNPALGVIRFLGSIIYDKATDKKDRAVLTRQLKEELEILEEKIAMAEREGNDRARIELIRGRQKLYKELERLTKVRYTAERRNQIREMQKNM